jgi:hypothetical protein
MSVATEERSVTVETRAEGHVVYIRDPRTATVRTLLQPLHLPLIGPTASPWGWWGDAVARRGCASCTRCRCITWSGVANSVRGHWSVHGFEINRRNIAL